MKVVLCITFSNQRHKGKEERYDGRLQISEIPLNVNIFMSNSFPPFHQNHIELPHIQLKLELKDFFTALRGWFYSQTILM